MFGRGFHATPGQKRSRRARVHRRWRTLAPWGVLFGLAFAVYLVNHRVQPAIAAGARALAIRAANAALSQAVTEELAHSAAAKQIVHYETDSTGGLRIADFDFSAVTRVQAAATEAAEHHLSALASETLSLPLGWTFGGALFSRMGPRLPVRMELVGSAHSAVRVETKTEGINQTVHVLYLDLSADVQVIAPLVAEPVTVSSRTPLAYVVFNGKVPSTMYGAGLPNPSSPNFPPAAGTH
ncbi:hypothetical protein GCM10025857_32730 [Alicyclobacillus contaminans]|uniref:sporulation protein YunB n=1 Tax=Alicyclobacillus contaminans TaxID=392016 RepID=UPI00041A7784|nr:sporulation protein YunB [Alicyclobacillus contaminans]GMA51916.1 hypothetical protein GCM10025857_32730 [Alicyclobacillus contaminans]